MSFLTYQPELQGTVFTPANLEFAREYLESAVRRVSPEWLLDPRGPLGRHWDANGNYSSLFLIDLARVLSTLDGNVTKKSTPIFHGKFRELLRADSDKQFTETLTELQVAAMLVERVSPIAFEPIVPEDQLNSANKPPSPDYAIRLPSGDVFIEVTVMYYGELEAWHKAVHEVLNTITGRLMKREVSRLVELRAPLTFRVQHVPKALIQNIVNSIVANDSGTLSLGTPDKGAQEGTIQWKTAHHYKSWDEVPPGPHLAFTMGDVAPGPLAAMEAFPLIDEATGERIVNSLRSTLDRKRTQFPHSARYILVVRLGQASVLPEGILQMIANRIWANPVYDWMAGICLFQPRTAFGTSDQESWMHLITNPKAQKPLARDLEAVFEGKTSFHL